MPETYDAPRPWTTKIETPLTLFRGEVRAEWIDEFDHVNTAHYLTIGDHANWAFWNWINYPSGTTKTREGHEYVIVESHIRYIDELALGSPIHVTTQLIGLDDKRYVLYHHIWKTEDGTLAATNEVKCLAFNLEERRPERWAALVSDRLKLINAAHQTLGRPRDSGEGVVLERR